MSKATRPTSRFCPSCSANISADRALCPQCERLLQQEVRQSHDVLRELDVELSRQSRKNDNAGRRTADTPLAYNQAASDAIVELRGAIRALAAAAPNIATHHVDRFRDARKNAFRIIDWTKKVVLVGVCPCTDDGESNQGVPLYAGPEDATVECWWCHEEYPVGKVAAWEHLEKVVAPLSECRQHMTVWGLRRTKSSLQRDLARSDFAPVCEKAGVTYWRLTDVITAAWDGGCRPADPQHPGLTSEMPA